jgi:DNA replication protein DnaC
VENRVGRVIRDCVEGALPWPLVLLGKPGTGKTCAALCLLDHAGGLYFTANGLADKVLLAVKGQLYNHDSHRRVSAVALWEEIATTTLVALDELGVRERVSDWHYECVYRVIDERSGRPLVVGSNLGLDVLAGLYDDRLTSRLAAGTVLELTGPDRRLLR